MSGHKDKHILQRDALDMEASERGVGNASSMDLWMQTQSRHAQGQFNAAAPTGPYELL